jgi:hypothetical protein
MRRGLELVAMAGLLCALSSCGDSTDPVELDGTMHANVVGSADPWDAEKTLTATMTNGNLVITGVENSTVTITLTVYDAAVGTFTANGGDPVPRIEATYGDDRSFSYTSAAGTGTANIVITELSATKAVGTFTFLAFPVFIDLEGTPTYHIVNGTFDVRIK